MPIIIAECGIGTKPELSPEDMYPAMSFDMALKPADGSVLDIDIDYQLAREVMLAGGVEPNELLQTPVIVAPKTEAGTDGRLVTRSVGSRDFRAIELYADPAAPYVSSRYSAYVARHMRRWLEKVTEHL